MNERIQELLVQSGLLINVSEHRVNELDPNIKKFAELLVRECTNMLPEDSVRNADGVHMFYVIREHFGVPVIGR